MSQPGRQGARGCRVRLATGPPLERNAAVGVPGADLEAFVTQLHLEPALSCMLGAVADFKAKGCVIDGIEFKIPKELGLAASQVPAPLAMCLVHVLSRCRCVLLPHRPCAGLSA